MERMVSMQYTPGRVYRHKHRAAKRYYPRAKARNYDPVFAVISLAGLISFLAMFVNWWLI